MQCMHARVGVLRASYSSESLGNSFFIFYKKNQKNPRNRSVFKSVHTTSSGVFKMVVDNINQYFKLYLKINYW